MTTSIVIVGVGGLAKEMTDLATGLGYSIEAYYTEPGAEVLHPLSGVRTVQTLDGLTSSQALIAIGNTAARQRFDALLRERFELPTLVHPSASVSPQARLGRGVLVAQNAVVSADAEVQDGSLVNVGVYVAHDCVVGSYSHIAAGVNLGGGVSVGAGAFLGTGAIVLPNKRVGAWATVGAGAVVTQDVPEGATVMGVPARSACSRDGSRGTR